MSRKLALVSPFAVLLVAGAVLSAGAEEKTITLEQVPAAVRAAMEAKAAGGKIVEVEQEDEDGGVTYEMEVLRDGKEFEYEFSSTGSLLEDEEGDDEEDDDDDEGEGDDEEIEASVTREELPAEVFAVFGPAVQGAEGVVFTREREGGATVYEAEYSIAGVGHALEVSEAGELLESEKQVAADALPAAVAKAIQARWPSAAIDGGEIVTTVSYEVVVTVDGKKKEVEVSPAGRIHGSEESDD